MEQHANDTENRVRQRAYELWEQHGRREGHEAEFWHQAERELKAKRAAATRAEASAPIRHTIGVVPDPTDLERSDNKAGEGSSWQLIRNIPVRLICPLGR